MKIYAYYDFGGTDGLEKVYLRDLRPSRNGSFGRGLATWGKGESLAKTDATLQDVALLRKLSTLEFFMED